MTITFYDLVAKDGVDTWSPNPFKTKLVSFHSRYLDGNPTIATRYSLGFKKLPYTTVRLEYPELEGEFKKHGIPPSMLRPKTGVPLYTSPSLTDDRTGAAISESYKIAEYLDQAYPDTPRLFPPGTEAFQAAFYEQFNQGRLSIYPIFIPNIPNILRPPSAEYFTRRRSEDWGIPLAELEPFGEARVERMNKAKEVFDSFDSFYSKSSGPFLMGDTPVFSDFIVVSLFHSLRVVMGENSVEWKILSKEWHNGRWGDLLARLEVYSKHPDQEVKYTPRAVN